MRSWPARFSLACAQKSGSTNCECRPSTRSPDSAPNSNVRPWICRCERRTSAREIERWSIRVGCGAPASDAHASRVSVLISLGCTPPAAACELTADWACGSQLQPVSLRRVESLWSTGCPSQFLLFASQSASARSRRARPAQQGGRHVAALGQVPPRRVPEQKNPRRPQPGRAHTKENCDSHLGSASVGQLAVGRSIAALAAFHALVRNAARSVVIHAWANRQSDIPC